MIAVLCALVLGACGSSGGNDTATGTAPAGTEPAGTATAPTSTGPTSGEAIEGDSLNKLPRAPEPSGTPPTLSGASAADTRTYLRAVFNDAQAFWRRQFDQAGATYVPARLTFFTGSVHSGCGAQADVGPFYCGANHGIYLDLGFFRLMAQRFGVHGFAQAYVLGHEFGHHVQLLTGITHRVAAANQADPQGENARSVRVELQADCLAGVWAHSVFQRGELTEQDIAQALRTAAVIGDDFQQHASGRVVDSSMWTHGSSEQRQRWLVTGFQQGDPAACDTFSS